MKKIFYILSIFLLVFSGCPDYEPSSSPDNITVFLDNTELNSVTIEEGETITLRAEVSPSTENVSITWERNNTNIAIVSSGEGAECAIQGIKAGSDRITVKAWRNTGDSPVIKRISVSVKSTEIKDIVFQGQQSIFAGEQQELFASLVPAYANTPITWSNPLNLTLSGEKITGVSAGSAKITATAGGINRTFDITVKAIPAISGLAIYNGTANITGSSIEIGLYEEITLSASPTPASETFFTWESDNPGVSVKNGVIKGLLPGQTAVIEAGAGGFSGTKPKVTVTVKTPVTGIKINYDNAENLPVSNVIWLAPNDQVKLKLEHAGGYPTIINWPVNSELTLTPSNNGENCTITYKNTITPLRFDDPPIELRVTAENDANNTEVSAVILVKKLNRSPIWAWDRARDANFNTDLSVLTATNAIHTLSGRGEKTGIPAAVWGNAIPYTYYGLKLNSSNNSSGKNPDAIGTPGNSTRIAVGMKDRTPTTASAHFDGDFDFLESFCEKDASGYKKDSTGKYILKPEAEGMTIRVSVDYEIIWTAGAGRDMWIMLNNNNANAAQSVMGTNSQILIEPLTAARGSRATAVTYIDIWDMVDRKLKGFENLEKAFICVIALSNGGSIYVSGIRIEYEEE